MRLPRRVMLTVARASAGSTSRGARARPGRESRAAWARWPARPGVPGRSRRRAAARRARAPTRWPPAWWSGRRTSPPYHEDEACARARGGRMTPAQPVDQPGARPGAQPPAQGDVALSHPSASVPAGQAPSGPARPEGRLVKSASALPSRSRRSTDTRRSRFSGRKAPRPGQTPVCVPACRASRVGAESSTGSPPGLPPGAPRSSSGSCWCGFLTPCNDAPEADSRVGNCGEAPEIPARQRWVVAPCRGSVAGESMSVAPGFGVTDEVLTRESARDASLEG